MMTEVKRRFLLPWWLVLGGTTLLLLAYTSPWMKLYQRPIYRFKNWVFTFNEEMTFGVWWSASLFLLAALLFYEVTAGEGRSLRRAGLQLALLLGTMVTDEIASLHEWVSGIGGWTALAPFGALWLWLLVDSLRRLWPERSSRRVFWLLLAGFLLLGTVPLQEYAEHNLTSQKFSSRYGRYIEESTELAGATVILLAAAYHRRRRWRMGFAGVVPDPMRMPHLRPILLAAFPLHLLALWLPSVDLGSWDGSPSAVYPYAVFFVLASYCYWLPSYRRSEGARAAEVRGFWAAAGLIFLACSVGAIQNLWGLVGDVVPGLRREWFLQPVPTYLALVLAAGFMGLALRPERDRRRLWLLALPLILAIFYQVAPRFQMHLAAGSYAWICVAAFLRASEPPRLKSNHSIHDQEMRWKT